MTEAEDMAALALVLLEEGRGIFEIIRTVRTASGCGLREAKGAYDAAVEMKYPGEGPNATCGRLAKELEEER